MATNGESRRRSQVDDEEEEEEIEVEEGGYFIGDIYIPPPPPPPDFSGEETGKRLVITYITNINFKSYAGKQTLGPFHKSFTSIVGPNGSGKSNVIDSMLFVFGYRAQKLRLKKLAHLIHRSDKFPDCTYCEVQVHFAQIEDEGGDDFNIVPGSDFIVSRTATKNNSSTYHLSQNGSNRRVVQFKDVSKLLESYGIDLKYNRFLILQGEVEQIALMKPKAENENETGMLEFLEDIIGSNRLVNPLSKLQFKVEELNDLRAEKINRVKVVEKEKQALEGPMIEAIKFLKTENLIALKRNEFYQIQRNVARTKEQEAEEAHKEAEVKYNDAMKQIELIKEERVIKVEENKKLIDEYEEQQKIVDANVKEFKDLEKKDLQMQERVKHTKSKGKKLVAELEAEKRKLNSLNEQVPEIKETIEQLTQKRDDLEEKRSDAEQNLAKVMGKINKETEKYQKEKEKIQAELLELQKGVNDAKSARDVAQEAYNLYMRRDKQEKSKLEQFKVRLEQTIREAKLKKDVLDKFLSEVPKMEKEISEGTEKMNRETDRINRFQDEYRNLKAKQSDAMTNRNANKTNNRVLNALMEAKRKGILQGIHGRLGDLGAIDAKYDVAVSTACSSLDNIVVDRVEDGQAAIKFLKEHHIGQATFIIIDKQRYLEGRWENRFDAPDNVPRLFDLIKCDPKFRTSFYYSLQNTLVATDLTQARRITAQKRLRVVTLDGKVVETSGAMSGGGRPRKGRMGTQVNSASDELTEEQLQALATEISNCSKAINESKEKISNCQRSVEKINLDLQTMKENEPKIRMEIESRERSIEELRNQIKHQEKVIADYTPDKEEIKRLQTEVDAADRSYQRCVQGTSGLEEKVHEIDIKIAEVMDKNLGTCKKLVQKLKNEISEIEDEITKKSASLKSTERNIEKTTTKIESLEKETNETRDLLNTLKEEVKKNEEIGNQLTEKCNESQKLLDEIQAKCDIINKSLKALKEKESELNSKNLDVKHNMERLKSDLDDKKREVDDWSHKISKLTLHRIPGSTISRPPIVPSTPTKEPQPGPSSAPDAEASQGTSSQQPNVAVNEEEEGQETEINENLPDEHLNKLNSHSLRNQIEQLEHECKSMKPNMAAIEEYRKKEDLYLTRAAELKEVTDKRDLMKTQYEGLRKQRMEEFKAGFMIITRKLKEMYRMITSGGDAELEWADSLDPFSEGINFSVRPNKKSWKRISNLSGGEKTLSSLSLIFALHFYKPSPLYVMDEIDAALDFKNVSIVANYIKERTRNTQFIIISLRNNMYELANRLIGIYKTYNCTKSVPFEYDTWPSIVPVPSTGATTNIVGGDVNNRGASDSTRTAGTTTIQSSQTNNINVAASSGRQQPSLEVGAAVGKNKEGASTASVTRTSRLESEEETEEEES